MYKTFFYTSVVKKKFEQGDTPSIEKQENFKHQNDCLSIGKFSKMQNASENKYIGHANIFRYAPWSSLSLSIERKEIIYYLYNL